MNIGISIVLYLVIGFVIMMLFCILTYCFNRRLQRALNNQDQVYSMIDQIRGREDNQDDGQYESFKNLRIKQQQKKGPNKELFQIQLSQVKQPLKGFDDNLYGMGRLRRRLEGSDQISTSKGPQSVRSSRSIGSIRSFRHDPKKLKGNISTRSKSSDSNDQRSINDDARKSTRIKKKPKIFYHKFVNKIVAYLDKGVFVVENDVKSICKREKVYENKEIKVIQILPDNDNFNDTLEAYGFQRGQFCAYKFQTTIQIPHVKNGQEYPITNLKTTEGKEQIQFAEYYCIKDQLQDNI